MVYLMRGLQKSRASSNSDQRKAQQEWMKFMPKKLLMSLTLTPITDRLIFTIMGVSLPKPRLDDVVIDDEEDIYGFANQEETGMWGSEDASAMKQADLIKKASVESLIILFKCIMLIIIYGYSTHVKSFRESHNNFSDNQAGLTRVIDSMIKKIV